MIWKQKNKSETPQLRVPYYISSDFYLLLLLL